MLITIKTQLQNKTTQYHCLNSIKTTDMLSQPRPFVSTTSLDTSNPSKSLALASRHSPNCMLVLTTSNRPALLLSNRYQMPSQPMTTNAWGCFWGLYSAGGIGRSRTVMSGLEMISCSWKLRFLLSLQQQSPKARERLRLPLTRPLLTLPPAFLIRCSQVGLYGLWSCESYVQMGPGVPDWYMAARESPQLAMYTLDLVMRRMLAVEPVSRAGLTFVGLFWAGLWL